MKNSNLKTKVKNTKGITLVALIITIIVLLILAMVSISLIINTGIITKTKTAVDKYSEGEIEEQIKLANQEYQMNKFTDDVQQTETEFLHLKLDTIYGTENVDIIGMDSLIIKIKNDGKMYAFQISSNGNIEQLIWVQDKTVVTNTKTGQTLEVGDTIYYDSGVTAYEGEGTNQGKWGILGAEDGKLLIMSKENVGIVTLIGKDGFLNGSSKLNNGCNSFINEKYANSARSVKVEDINKITGYMPATPVKYTYTMVEGKVKRNDQTNPSSETEFEDINGKTLPENSLISVTANDYKYSLTEQITSEKAYNLLINNDSYWLDSQIIYAVIKNVGWAYRYVGKDYVNYYGLWYSNDGERGHNVGRRIVVYLKTNVKIVLNDDEETYSLRLN